MTTQHTSGPWKAVYVGCGDWDLNGPITQEDWTLASAAPDLLEALEDVMYWDNGKPEWEIARAAIAKATGQA
jgi:hypothetical protein